MTIMLHIAICFDTSCWKLARTLYDPQLGSVCLSYAAIQQVLSWFDPFGPFISSHF